MLIHFAPGAPREECFETLAEWARSGCPTDETEVAELYARHDNARLPEGDRPTED